LCLSDLEVCPRHGGRNVYCHHGILSELRQQFFLVWRNDNEKSQSTLDESGLWRRVSHFGSRDNSESAAEYQPKRRGLLRHGKLLQSRGQEHVLLQEENEERQECTRLLRGQGWRSVLLQG
jgi:hypothetical protein